MGNRGLIAIFILSFVGVAHSTWDTSTPAGTEAKSLGDDRIREFKTDVETSFQYEGDFPGSDTSDPRFIYTPSTGTTANRPTGNDAPNGRLYINTTIGCIEQYDGASWNCVGSVSTSSITSAQISSTVAGAGLLGGGGTAFSVNYDPATFEIVTDSLTVKTGGITSDDILNAGIFAVDLSSDIALPGEVTIPSQVRFLAFNNSADSNVTGDNTTVTVDFDTEVFDTGSDFTGDTFTAPRTGYYQLNMGVTIYDTAVGNKCELRIITSNRTYTQEAWPLSSINLGISVLADMDSGDTASGSLNCSGGAQVVDVLGNGGSTVGAGYPTFFSGYLAN